LRRPRPEDRHGARAVPQRVVDDPAEVVSLADDRGERALALLGLRLERGLVRERLPRMARRELLPLLVRELDELNHLQIRRAYPCRRRAEADAARGGTQDLQQVHFLPPFGFAPPSWLSRRAAS